MLRTSSPIFLILAFILTGCGGGGGGVSGAIDSISGSESDNRTATVGVLITDASSDDYDEAITTISSIELLCENGKQSLFTGSATFDLLRLTSFVELLTVKEGIQPDTCSKIRLKLDGLVLNVLDDSGDVISSVVATLVANGKIDLKANPHFTIHPGETLFAALDFDVGRSLKFTETGNGKVIVRPVIFVRVGSFPGFKEGLTRVFGEITAIHPDAGAMRICMDRLTAQPTSMQTRDELPKRCLLVALDGDTGVFGQDGLPIQANELRVGDPVTVVGLLAIAIDDGGVVPVPLAALVADDSDSDSHGESDSDSDSDSDGGNSRPPAPPFVLEAIVVERGGPGAFRQIAGVLQSGVDPANDTYGLLIGPGQGFAPDSMLTGQLFAQSRIIDPDGTDIDRSNLRAADRTIVDGVLLLKNNEIDANALRTALMIIRQGASIDPVEEILIGKILNIENQTFRVTTEIGDRCVDAPDADVLFLVETEGSLEVIRGTVDDLTVGIVVITYGTENDGGCFDADLIVSRDPQKTD